MVYGKNEYILNKEYAIMKIHSNTHGDFEVMIDLEDVERCSKHSWHIQKIYRSDTLFYVKSCINKKHMLLHRFITHTTKNNDVVDHINGNGLDNRSCNLRAVSQSDNLKNRTKERNFTKSEHNGVYWYDCIKNPKWVAYITLNYKRKHLGYFDRLEDAIAAREEAEEKYFGEYIRE
ncbi:MAG: hypothetical protein ACRDD7_01460 [Peptostreptococcaceae bacterium]